jgi:hypothetical protein
MSRRIGLSSFLALSRLSYVLIALLASDLALFAARLIMPQFGHGDPAWKVEIHLKPAVILSRVAFVATIIVFLLWFQHTRDNAGRHGLRR